MTPRVRRASAVAFLLLAPGLRADGLKLALSVSPRVLLGGGDLRVECRVPRISQYQSVTWGVEGDSFSTSSTRQLPGPVIHQLLTKVPARTCGALTAFCVVRLHDHLGDVAAPPVTVLTKGLDCPDEVPQ